MSRPRHDRRLSVVTRRPRRLPWNNDGSDMIGPAYGRGTWPIPILSPETFIDNCMRFLVGTPVDSLFYCAVINVSDWELPTVNTAALGPNPVRHVVDFAHRHDMEFFYSVRMNDSHAAGFPPNEVYWPPFKLDHPELFIAPIDRAEWEGRYLPYIEKFIAIDRDRRRRGDASWERDLEVRLQSDREHPLADVIRRRGRHSRDLWTWAAYDYAKPAVRDFYLDIVRGACERYDLDGVELDWLRYPTYFRPGEERRNIPIMNDVVRQVRLLLDDHARRRGRPILLAARLPDTPEQSLGIGLVNAGMGFNPFSYPIDQWAALCHQFDVPVYGCLDRLCPVLRTGRPKFDNRDPALTGDALRRDAVHAASYRALARGADGVYLFDYFTHHGPTDPADHGQLPALHDRAGLARADKLYQIDPDWPIRASQPGAFSQACVPGQLPRAFTTRSGPIGARLTLDVADDPVAVRSAALLTRWADADAAERVTVAVNGQPLIDPSPTTQLAYGNVQHSVYGQGFVVQDGWTRYPLAPSALRPGLNTIDVTVQPPRRGDPDTPLELLETRLALHYQQNT